MNSLEALDLLYNFVYGGKGALCGMGENEGGKRSKQRFCVDKEARQPGWARLGHPRQPTPLDPCQCNMAGFSLAAVEYDIG